MQHLKKLNLKDVCDNKSVCKTIRSYLSNKKNKKRQEYCKGKANCRNHLKPNSLVKYYDDYIKFKKIKESLVWVNCE